MEDNKNSILDMVQGGVRDLINSNVADMLINIRDLNTDLKKRELVVKVTLTPADSKRRKIDVRYDVASKLRPLNPIATTIAAGITEDGELQAVELMEDITGQMMFDGDEIPEPVVINFPKRKEA